MLKKVELWNVVNLIIISDYGMIQCFEERVIEFDQYLDKDYYILIDKFLVVVILLKDGKCDRVVV